MTQDKRRKALAAIVDAAKEASATFKEQGAPSFSYKPLDAAIAQIKQAFPFVGAGGKK